MTETKASKGKGLLSDLFLTEITGRHVVLVLAGLTFGVIVTPLSLVWFSRNYALLPDQLEDTYALIGGMLSVLVVLLPIVHHIVYGQNKKREQIENSYYPELIAEYFYQFWWGRTGSKKLVEHWQKKRVIDDTAGSLDPTNSKLATDEFRKLLEDFFGPQRYLIPMALLTATSFSVMLLAFQNGIIDSISGRAIEPNNRVSMAAICGVYMWVASDSISRSYQGIFDPSTIYWYCLRFIIAVPLGVAIAATASQAPGSTNSVEWSAAVAFLIGMFSLDRIKSVVGGLVNRALNIPAAGPAESKDLAINLPGVDQAMAERLANEGITTILDISSADPVTLSIRSGIAFDSAIKLIDAAILWNYTKSQLDTFKGLGWSGASDVLDFSEKLGPVSDKQLRYLENSATSMLALREELAEIEVGLLRAEKKLAMLISDSAKTAGDLGAEVESATTEVADLICAKEKKQEKLAQQLGDLQQATAVFQSADCDLFLSQAAEATAMKIAGIKNIVAQISSDKYARFIRQVLQA